MLRKKQQFFITSNFLQIINLQIIQTSTYRDSDYNQPTMLSPSAHFRTRMANFSNSRTAQHPKTHTSHNFWKYKALNFGLIDVDISKPMSLIMHMRHAKRTSIPFLRNASYFQCTTDTRITLYPLNIVFCQVHLFALRFGFNFVFCAERRTSFILVDELSLSRFDSYEFAFERNFYWIAKIDFRISDIKIIHLWIICFFDSWVFLNVLVLIGFGSWAI